MYQQNYPQQGSNYYQQELSNYYQPAAYPQQVYSQMGYPQMGYPQQPAQPAYAYAQPAYGYEQSTGDFVVTMTEANPGIAEEVRYPLAMAGSVRMSGKQRMASILFLTTMIALIAGMIYVFVGVLGFDSMSELYGFEYVIETFDVEPPPKI